MQESGALAAHWLSDKFQEDGLFAYEYFPWTNVFSPHQNDIRQLMSARTLAVIACNDSTLEEIHQKNIDAVLTKWYRKEGKVGAIVWEGASKLGANAMAMRALIASPFRLNYLKELAALHAAIISVQQENGQLQPWIYKPDFRYSEELLMSFYAGEAILALTEYALFAGDEAIWRQAELSATFYREYYLNRLGTEFMPPCVPWFSMAFKNMYAYTQDSLYAKAIFQLTDQLLILQEKDSTSGELKGSFRHPDSHSASDAVYAEGLVAAAGLALEQQELERADYYLNSLKQVSTYLLSLQITSQTAESYPDPRRSLGGIAVSPRDSRQRIDQVQHWLDAIYALMMMKGVGGESANKFQN